jgi:mevalonate kinase
LFIFSLVPVRGTTDTHL